MKIETRKRKRATQKVKAKFFFGPKGECFVSAFQKVTSLSFWSLRYPFGHSFSSSVGTRMRRKRDLGKSWRIKFAVYRDQQLKNE